QAFDAAIGSSLSMPEEAKLARFSSASRCLGALASSQLRTWARKAASSGVSSKFIVSLRSGRRFGVAGAHPFDQQALPGRQRPQRQRQGVGAPVVEVAVEGPGEAHAAVHLDV